MSFLYSLDDSDDEEPTQKRRSRIKPKAESTAANAPCIPEEAHAVEKQPVQDSAATEPPNVQREQRFVPAPQNATSSTTIPASTFVPTQRGAVQWFPRNTVHASAWSFSSSTVVPAVPKAQENVSFPTVNAAEQRPTQPSQVYPPWIVLLVIFFLGLLLGVLVEKMARKRI